jgi:hypothetical protein
MDLERQVQETKDYFIARMKALTETPEVRREKEQLIEFE